MSPGEFMLINSTHIWLCYGHINGHIEHIKRIYNEKVSTCAQLIFYDYQF